jgi:hypothetical protein
VQEHFPAQAAVFTVLAAAVEVLAAAALVEVIEYVRLRI